jgi:large subunit ribosomal protein L21
MDAFVELSGKQIRVTEGMEFSTFRLGGKKVGDKVELNPVCYIEGDNIITDEKKLKAVKVVCDILREEKGPKIYSFKKKPKTGYKKGYGHRDRLMVLKVASITQK